MKKRQKSKVEATKANELFNMLQRDIDDLKFRQDQDEFLWNLLFNHFKPNQNSQSETLSLEDKHKSQIFDTTGRESE